MNLSETVPFPCDTDPDNPTVVEEQNRRADEALKSRMKELRTPDVRYQDGAWIHRNILF
jgi:hypothetical protein